MLLVLLCSNCRKDKFITLDYPRLKTLNVTSITNSGATFNAEIISSNADSVKEYGFTWNPYVTPDLSRPDSALVKQNLTNPKFSGVVHSLKKDQVYFVRAFIRTDKLLIYGTTVTFKTSK
jgi:hypothetical protein